jgi:hypothetical protein
VSGSLRQLEKYEEWTFLLNPNLIKVVKISVMLAFTAHIDACVWHYYGLYGGTHTLLLLMAQTSIS